MVGSNSGIREESPPLSREQDCSRFPVTSCFFRVKELSRLEIATASFISSILIPTRGTRGRNCWLSTDLQTRLFAAIRGRSRYHSRGSLRRDHQLWRGEMNCGQLSAFSWAIRVPILQKLLGWKRRILA